MSGPVTPARPVADWTERERQVAAAWSAMSGTLDDRDNAIAAARRARECEAAGDRPGGAAWWAVAGDGYRDAVERADGREPLVIV